MGIEIDPWEERDEYLNAAKKGDIDAQFRLGEWYVRVGQGFEPDFSRAKGWYKEAAEWYGKAAAQGQEMAKEKLDDLKSSGKI